MNDRPSDETEGAERPPRGGEVVPCDDKNAGGEDDDLDADMDTESEVIISSSDRDMEESS